MLNFIHSAPLKRDDIVLLFGLGSKEEALTILEKVGREGRLFIIDPFGQHKSFSHPQVTLILENRRFSSLIDKLSSAFALIEPEAISRVKVVLNQPSFKELLKNPLSGLGQEIKILLEKKELNRLWADNRIIPSDDWGAKFLQILRIALVASPGIAHLNRLLETRLDETFFKERKTKKISIIILAWNGWEKFTCACLLSIFEKTDYPDYEVIVVDNGSTDGTSSGLKSFGKRIRVITNKENRGFSFGNNQAAKIAGGEYLLFLNNDTLVKSGDWLTIMADTLELHPGIGATGQFGVVYLDDKTDAFAQVVFMPEVVIPVAWLAAYCLMVKREAFFEAGCFRDDLYGIAGCEDIHLSYALRERGWLSVTTPEWIYLNHFVGGSREANPFVRDNYEILARQWGSRRRILNCAQSNETALGLWSPEQGKISHRDTEITEKNKDFL